ncbi:helix-turn-helix domain-containing protein [Streptomyces sp. NRRL B-1347]|uniref:helix-turn-helix domain-containing protein n=1 Tax=Streptomyces sp. NRRL B-1347 TaxID=1476877 RepID=UPI0004CC64BE|nr:transcriptional regulator [Streptomyces sp. NRRL B-1347]
MTGYTPPTALPAWLLGEGELRAAAARHDFGTLFRLARQRAGISYSQIAAECDIKPDRVGTLARGRGKVATFEKIVQICDALRIPGHLAGLADRPWEARPASGEAEVDEVLRRRFVQVAGLAATMPTTLAQPSGRIGRRTVASLRERTARLRRLDDVLGGGDTYRVYTAEYQATKALLRDTRYDEATGRALLSLLAEQAQQAGWAAFDGGCEADAVSLYEASRTAALDAGDTALSGNALAFLAYQRLGGDRRAGAEIASRSTEAIGGDTPAGVRALLHERRAWACAVADMPTEAERSLAAASAALAEVHGQPQPDWAAWVDHTEVDIMTGRCWAELRRPLRAVPVLEAALARYDDSHARDKALYSSWLAQAYLTAGEAEQSAAVVSRALALSDGVASVRPRKRLAPVLNDLSAARYRTLPAVADLLDQARG